MPFTSCRFLFPATVLAVATALCQCPGASETPAVKDPHLEEFVLPRTSLARFCRPVPTAAELAVAVKNGLRVTDSPGIGSGLCAGEKPGEFYGLTDRGPNETTGKKEDKRRLLPLPQFVPSMVRFRLREGKVEMQEIIPLTDGKGKPLNGRNNHAEEEPLFAGPDATVPLPSDPNGVDPEDVQRFPDGRFLIAEEYGPSLLVADAQGRVLLRYLPQNKTLPGTGYPVRNILPDILRRRRVNHGFESLALSSDGRTAYALLQGPMGEDEDSRIVRAVRLDVSDPLQARLTGLFLVPVSKLEEYPETKKQERIKFSAATWLGKDRLLLLERGKDRVKLVDVNFAGATDLRTDPRAGTLTFEETAFKKMPVTPAATHVLWDSPTGRIFGTDKLEGLALLAPDAVAIVNDNDFGIGDNENDYPSKVWKLTFAQPLFAAP